MKFPGRSADTILLNAKIWTENPQQPEVEALAITADRVAATGSASEVLAFRGPKTEVIDLDGRRVVPGFNDAHVHFCLGGLSLSSVQLRDAKSPQEFRDRIAQFVRSRPKGEWILLGEWDPESWNPPGLPTHEIIDDVTPDHPVFVNRIDAHTMLANALAMKLAGVDRNTKDIAGGVIGRDAEGNLTGIFIDAAKPLIERVIPPPTPEQMCNALLAAQDHALKHGVTSVHEMGLLGAQAATSSIDLFRAYQMAHGSGRLKTRVNLHIPLRQWKKLADLGVRSGFGDSGLQIGAVKGFSDGSLGSSTAWFFEPYTDKPDTCGAPSDELSNPAEMFNNMRQADRAGLQLSIHAIGDRANRTVLDFYAKFTAAHGARDRRLRIEHAQHLHSADISRFSAMNVIASVQPYHCADDGRWADRRIGPERAKTTYAFRSLLDAGVRLALGSDWWVAPIDPMKTLHAAITRRPLDGSRPEGWVPEQKITVTEAVHAYTMGSAYASFEEHRKGSLEPGKLADLVVLSQDIFAIDPQHILDTRVDLTVLGGQVAYRRGA